MMRTLLNTAFNELYYSRRFLNILAVSMNYEELKNFFNKHKGRLVSLSSIAAKTPYSPQYLSLRARQGKLWAIKFNRDWLTTKDAVDDYIQKQKQHHAKALNKFSKFKAGD